MRLIALAALVGFGALNREMTGILIWLAVFVAYPRRWRWWLPLGAILTLMIIGLRLTIDAPSNYSIPYIFGLNLEAWRITDLALYGGLLLIPIILFYYSGRLSTSRVRYMIAGVLLPYLVLYALFGIWAEVRLLMPVFIFGIPLLRVRHA